MLRKWMQRVRRYAFWGWIGLLAFPAPGRAQVRVPAYASGPPAVSPASVAPAASPVNSEAADLRALIEAQGKQIQELQRQLQALTAQQHAADGAAADKEDDDAAKKKDTGAAAKKEEKPKKEEAKKEEDAVKKLVGDYLKEHPGAGVPPSVQAGYFSPTGFTI